MGASVGSGTGACVGAFVSAASIGDSVGSGTGAGVGVSVSAASIGASVGSGTGAGVGANVGVSISDISDPSVGVFTASKSTAASDSERIVGGV
jgi:hypothetical protein